MLSTSFLLAGKMAGSEEVPEDQTPIHETEHGEQPEFNKDGELWVDLNESRNNNSEFLRTVEELKVELQRVKGDNERILKAQEELNQILKNKLNIPRNEKSKEYKFDEGTTISKPRKKKLEFSDSESDSSSTRNYDSSENYDSKPTKKKYKPYEEILGEFKKIKPPVFNGEIEKGEEDETWLSGMKKYFQIYNYSDRLKARMAIYNLTVKVDI